MFKLGGEVNSHGVGLTSGLNYNRPGYKKGGDVAPVGQVGKGPLQMEGPDGKMREMQNPLALLRFLVPGAYSVGRVGSRVAKGGLDALKRYFRPRTGRAPGGERVIPGRPIREVTPRGTTIRSRTIRTPGERLPPGYRDYLRMTPRYLGAGIGGLGVLGGISSLAPRGEPETALGKTFEGLRTGAEGAFNLMTGLPIGALQSPFRSFEDIQAPSTLIRESIYGPETPKESPAGSETVPVTPPMEAAATQEEEFAQMRADADARAEMYYNMLSEGGPDKIRALSDAFTQAGAMWDDDKAAALSGFKSGIDAELDRDATLRDEARRLGVSDVVSLSEEERQAGKAKQQMIDQAKLAIISSPDLMPDARAQALKGIEAWEAGVIDTLPINAKQDAADPARLSIGNIYFDPYNLYGGMYVGVSSDADDPDGQIAGFDSLEEAQAHAAG